MRRFNMNWKSTLFAVPLATALVACPDTKPTPTTDFTIASVAPTSLSFTKLASGQPAPQTVTVTITPANGFADAVTLSLVAPAGSSGVTGTGTIAASSYSGTVSVTSANAANVGDNQAYLVQATSGSITKTLALPISIKDVAVAPQTVEIKSTAALDGVVFSDNNVFNDKSTIRVGNDGATGKGFVSFDLSILPATVTAAKIVSVNLVIYQELFDPVLGTCDPYIKLTNATDKLFVESVSFGATLNPAAYSVPVLSKIGNLSTTNVTESKTLDVTAAVKDDVTNKTARGSRSQFRLHFPVEYNATTAPTTCSVRLTSTEGAPPANQPKLVIAYTP
jgi:hypothetical protein